MDGVMLKKFMIKKAQIAIKKIGSTNRARWVLFSPFDEITPSQFATQLQKFDVSLNPAEVYALWKKCGIKSRVMKFDDFVKFIYYEMPPTPYDNDSYLQFYELVRSRKHLFLQHFMGCDPESTGFIKITDFFDICHSLLPQSTDVEISLFCQNYDTQNNGTLNYFQMMSDFNTSSLNEKTKPVYEIKTPIRNVQDNMLIFSEDLARLPYTRGPGFGGRGQLDPEVFLGTNRNKSRRNSFSDVEAFPSDNFNYNNISRNTPRTPQTSRVVFQTSSKTPDELEKNQNRVSPKSVYTLPLNTSLETIMNAKQKLATSVSKIGSAQDFFTKWQNGTILGADDIHTGLLAELQYDFPIDLLHIIVQCNGGPFTLSEFVSMISDAEAWKTKKVDFTKLRRETEEDVVLTRIAQRTVGKPWEETVYEAATPKSFVEGLHKVNVYITENDIQTLYDRLGTNGLINAIKDKTKSLYVGELTENIPK